MNTISHNSNLSTTKRPIIVTVVCCIILLVTIFGILSLRPYFSSDVDLKSLVGEKNYYLGMSSSILTVLLFIPVIGIWKMKKPAGYLYVIVTLLIIFLGFAVDTLPQFMRSQQQNGMVTAIGPMISLSMIFIIVYHVILNNPKSESSAITQRQCGVLTAIIGIGFIIVAQTYTFTISQTYQTGTYGGLPDSYNIMGSLQGTDMYVDTIKKNLFLYTGITLLIGGVCFYALSLNRKNKEAILSHSVQKPQTVTIQESDIVYQIEKLDELRKKGLLSEDEFNAKKGELLAKM